MFKYYYCFFLFWYDNLLLKANKNFKKVPRFENCLKFKQFFFLIKQPLKAFYFNKK